MDETGIAEGVGTNGKRIGTRWTPGSKASRWAYVKARQNRTWVSIIECISAGGDRLPPAVIYTGSTLQQQWFDENLDGYAAWKFAASPNGYSSNDLGYEWLTRHFIPLTDPGQKEWRLLILDGHDSHVTDDFMVACAINRIYLCVLPAHSSHVTQPLDVGCFSVLKQKYRQYIESHSYDDLSSARSKQLFLLSYKSARDDALTSRNIRSGWRATGLWPVDISKPLGSKFIIPDDPPTPPAKTAVADESAAALATPSDGKQLRKSLGHLRGMRGRQPALAREAIRKASKALDKKNRELAEAEMQKRALEEQIANLRPKKRQKVDISPNKRFASLGHIQLAQAKARAAAQSIPGSPDTLVEGLSGTCIDL